MQRLTQILSSVRQKTVSIMPSYDYRCNQCGRELTLFYKSYKDYDAAIHTCPHCQSNNLTRLISRVSLHGASRDYTTMSSNEMLSVLEGGNSQEVGRMMDQFGQGDASLGADYHEATDRLLKGDKPEKIETDLRANESAKKPDTGSADS